MHFSFLKKKILGSSQICILKWGKVWMSCTTCLILLAPISSWGHEPQTVCSESFLGRGKDPQELWVRTVACRGLGVGWALSRLGAAAILWQEDSLCRWYQGIKGEGDREVHRWKLRFPSFFLTQDWHSLTYKKKTSNEVFSLCYSGHPQILKVRNNQATNQKNLSPSTSEMPWLVPDLQWEAGNWQNELGRPILNS